MKIPDNQILWVTRQNSDCTPKQIITSDYHKEVYYLYNVLPNGNLKKIETNFQPIFKYDMKE